ncbi:MAG: 50S ribosomal protein L14e [Candidatus Micrarchaeota archaeon]
MKAFDKDRKCVILTGRRSGEYCTILKEIDTNFVEVELDSKKGKARRMNKKHLEPIK